MSSSDSDNGEYMMSMLFGRRKPSMAIMGRVSAPASKSLLPLNKKKYNLWGDSDSDDDYSPTIADPDTSSSSTTPSTTTVPTAPPAAATTPAATTPPAANATSAPKASNKIPDNPFSAQSVVPESKEEEEEKYKSEVVTNPDAPVAPPMTPAMTKTAKSIAKKVDTAQLHDELNSKETEAFAKKIVATIVNSAIDQAVKKGTVAPPEAPAMKAQITTAIVKQAKSDSNSKSDLLSAIGKGVALRKTPVKPVKEAPKKMTKDEKQKDAIMQAALAKHRAAMKEDDDFDE